MKVTIGQDLSLVELVFTYLRLGVVLKYQPTRAQLTHFQTPLANQSKIQTAL